MEFSQPRVTITAVVRTLFREGRLRDFDDLSLGLAPYRTNWGFLFSRSGTIPGKLLDQFA